MLRDRVRTVVRPRRSPLQAMATPGSQAKGGIIDVNDLRYFVRIFSKNWYFVVVALVLSAALSYLYSYKIPEVHGASAQILLKDREVYNYQTQVYQNIGYVAAYSDIVNQKRVLTSYDLVDKALSKLDFDISYYIIGRFKVSQVYGSLPFTVKIDLLNPKYYQRPFDLRVVDADHYELSYDGGTGIVSKVYAFGLDVMENDFLLRVDKSEQLAAGSFEKVTASDYQFVRHSRPWLVNKYKSGMVVENLDYTTILQVTVEDEIPARAKMFLDTLSREYINYTLQSEFDINQNTLNYIDKQLDEVTVILNQFEDELQRYKESRNILDLSREEDRYFNELVRFDNERRKLELMIQSLNDLEDYVVNIGDEKLLPPSFYILEDDVFLRNTLSELYAMQMNRNSMLFDATPENLSVNRLDSTIMLNRGNLLVYVKNSRKAIEAKIRDVQAQMDDYERLIRTVPLSQRDILNIERRLQVNEKLYLFLLEKRANTVIARAGIVPQTKVIELARSIGVVRPDKVKILYAFMVGGIVISLVIVFIRVMFYDRIENADQLKAMVHMPVFGEIIASDKAEENYVVVDSDPKSAITESFRTVRTNLEYLPGPQGTGRVVLVTSYRPNEGKTFCSVNLSAILAKAGKRVMLLELDLHKPKVGKGLNMTSTQGLSNLLVGHVEPAAVVQPTQIENFHVILSGPTPPNASELVLSRHLEELFRYGRQHYDYVIIDTPPVGLITDALVMMKHVDATLFVVNTRFANKDHLTSAMEVIQSNPVRNFGFILNGVRMKKSKYYYNTNYGYGYRYAYGYGSGYGYGYGYGRRKRGKDAKDGADTEA
ncbi:MAG: polysaccharide biosynthesis tyrosine autokinase [Flavobacteriales bacterium]|nr:polysaccharide biosynthesis tyrosine autokinase [Flavobacteriales bacterium]MBK9700870.1 polysaccharide biosynthesis tyrosine autokinase [Flavobacteriales bacterium]